MKYTTIQNNQSVPLRSIPELDYADFMEWNVFSLMTKIDHHCVNYFGYPQDNKIKLICCVANDSDHVIYLSSTIVDKTGKLPSFSAHNLCFEKFEREIHENFGIEYLDHPWLKPLRYAHNRTDKTLDLKNYPFYSIDSEELHEVGVGPIHAGVIEPGHFRFLCNGEQILHLEIQLGYQHRGVEQLFLTKKKIAQQSTLAESIAGDTAVGHGVAFANLRECLTGFKPTRDMQYARTLALELERLAIHTGDLSALCTDIAYQLGSSVFGRLRTPIINYFQIWCGNRLAKGMIRPGQNKYPFDSKLAEQLQSILNKYEPHFLEMAEELFRLPSAMARFEKTGVVTSEQANQIGCVGMAARASGVKRDIRFSHPHDLYKEMDHKPIMFDQGDVFARTILRKEEIVQSISYIRDLIKKIPIVDSLATALGPLQPEMFALSLVEGWRGEICHCAITDAQGELILYKIKDPSVHNWLALALSVRNNEISDFPICNKSFNLSYCGHDL